MPVWVVWHQQVPLEQMQSGIQLLCSKNLNGTEYQMYTCILLVKPEQQFRLEEMFYVALLVNMETAYCNEA